MFVVVFFFGERMILQKVYGFKGIVQSQEWDYLNQSVFGAAFEVHF